MRHCITDFLSDCCFSRVMQCLTGIIYGRNWWNWKSKQYNNLWSCGSMWPLCDLFSQNPSNWNVYSHSYFHKEINDEMIFFSRKWLGNVRHTICFKHLTNTTDCIRVVKFLVKTVMSKFGLFRSLFILAFVFKIRDFLFLSGSTIKIELHKIARLVPKSKS